MRLARCLVTVMLAGAVLAVPAVAGPARPKGPLNTIADIGKALRSCWQWPPASEARSGMELTIRLSFKRNGEIFGARITYETRDVSDEERALYPLSSRNYRLFPTIQSATTCLALGTFTQ